MMQQHGFIQQKKSSKKVKRQQKTDANLPSEITWIIERINNPIAGFEHLSTESGEMISKEEQILATKQQLYFIARDLSVKKKNTDEIISVLKYYMH